MNLQLAMHSSPRFATWIWIPDWHAMFDAGDGVTQHLGFKIHKIDAFAMTHAHRDHIGGLLQVINQRGAAGSFAIGFPRGSNSFPQLEAFANKWNPGTSWKAVWQGLDDGSELECGIEGRVLRAFRTRHYIDDVPPAPPRSLGYHLIWRKKKLLPELEGISQQELTERARRDGTDSITHLVEEKWVTVGGDGQPLDPEEVAGTQLLLHEATFLSADDYDAEDAGEDVGHVHSTVDNALAVAHAAGVPQLVLYHISTRYTEAEIREAVRGSAQRIGFEGQIWAAMPRRIYWNLLGDKPLWDGAESGAEREVGGN